MIDRDRRAIVLGAAGAAASSLVPASAHAQNLPGVTATELKIGSTTSFSGPVSALGTINKAQLAYFKMINEQGGVAGRKINYIVYDDGFSPPKTLEQTRRLLEQDEVAFLFANLGTGPNSAIVKYVNNLGVPHLFLGVNGDKWGDYKAFPWSMGFGPSGRVEAQIYVKYTLQQKPDAKIALLFQNDDFGRDYVLGAKDVLGSRYDSVVTAVSFEVTDPSIASQLIQLQGSGADVLLSGVTGKFGALAIRTINEIGWKPMHFIPVGVSSVAATIVPAGVDRSIGTITSVYTKDPSDPAWSGDAGVKAYREFMTKYYPEGNPDDFFNVHGYITAAVLVQLLNQCKGDFSRKSIMAQANNLKDVENPMLLPGIRVNTSPTNHNPLRQMQLQRWNGKQWERFGSIIEGSSL